MMTLGVKSRSPEETRFSPFPARCLRLRPGGSLNVPRETHCETYRARDLPWVVEQSQERRKLQATILIYINASNRSERAI